MGIAKDGSFSFVVNSENLVKGLNFSDQLPRNIHHLTESKGVIGKDGVLKSIDDLEPYRINTDSLNDNFPYPQIFNFTRITIVCGKTHIYEYDFNSGTLIDKLTVEPGIIWSAVDFYEFIYMSNGAVAVVRNASGTWNVTNELPVASGMVNYNGQVMIGAPDVERF